MRQTNLFEFLNDLAEAARQEQFKETGTEDETPTNCDFGEPVRQSPIEIMISGFIETMTEAGQIPTLEQTQSIILLDALAAKYRGN